MTAPPSRPTSEEVDRSLEFAEKHASIETTDDEIENILAAEVRVLRQEQAEQHRNCVHRHELEKVKAERDAMREAEPYTKGMIESLQAQLARVENAIKAWHSDYCGCRDWRRYASCMALYKIASLTPPPPEAEKPCEGMKRGLRCSPCVSAKRTCQPEGVTVPEAAKPCCLCPDQHYPECPRYKKPAPSAAKPVCPHGNDDEGGDCLRCVFEPVPMLSCRHGTLLPGKKCMFGCHDAPSAGSARDGEATK